MNKPPQLVVEVDLLGRYETDGHRLQSIGATLRNDGTVPVQDAVIWVPLARSVVREDIARQYATRTASWTQLHS